MTKESAHPTSTPNILWICTDQQRWDTLGCLGNPFTHTPNLDRLAAGGALFTHGYSQSPVCTPSRACFLTGRYPRTTRCRQNGQAIDPGETLVTRLFANAGYRCGLSGKLHLAPCHPRACKSVEPRIDDGYQDFHWSHHPHPDEWPGHNEYREYLRSRGRRCDVRPHPDSRWVLIGPPEEDHHTTWCFDRAIDFVRARAPHRDDSASRGDGSATGSDGGNRAPWLFSVNCFDPHHPFDAPEAYLKRYMPILESIPLPNYEAGELDGKTEYQRIDHGGAYGRKAGYPYPEMSDREHRLARASYWAMCDLIDVQVGRLLRALDETGQRDNTLVLFHSDHGELLGDHGIYLKGPFFYEPSIRVPLIASWPGRIAPRRSDALVELVDLPQTLLDAAGLPHHPGMQGRSLWPLLRGDVPGDTHRDDVYCEYYNALDCHSDPTAQLTMVRDRRHKLVVDHSGGAGELYDLDADPRERRNLWNDPAALPLKAALLQRLCDRMAWTVDPLPARQSGW